MQKGFTLLEVLIVVAIISLIGAAGAASYRSLGKDAELLAAKKTLIADLKYAQSRAMIGDGGVKWGVHSVNSVNDYYEVFSTPTDYTSGSMVQISTTTLARAISFSDPASNTTKDIIFSRISGTTTPTTLTLVAEDRSEVITVTSLGTVY